MPILYCMYYFVPSTTDEIEYVFVYHLSKCLERLFLKVKVKLGLHLLVDIMACDQLTTVSLFTKTYTTPGIG